MPAPRPAEVISYGVAGLAGLAPIYMMLAPGTEELLARHTARWAPRWEMVTSRYLSPPGLQNAVRHHMSPPVERAMQRMDTAWTQPHVQPQVVRASKLVERRLQNVRK